MAIRTMNPVHDATCSVAACAEIVGQKWTALLVHDLSEGPRRFSELEHACPGISPRTLSERLRSLESEGMLVRRSYAESPPRVEYELTAKGEGLAPDRRRDAALRPRWLGCGADHAGPNQAVRPGKPGDTLRQPRPPLLGARVLAASFVSTCTPARAQRDLADRGAPPLPAIPLATRP